MIFSFSFSTVNKITNSNSRAEAIFTGFDNFCEREGNFRLINIPIRTGISTIINTSMIFLNCTGMYCPSSIK
jgi:hypothetical protein